MSYPPILDHTECTGMMNVKSVNLVCSSFSQIVSCEILPLKICEIQFCDAGVSGRGVNHTGQSHTGGVQLLRPGEDDIIKSFFLSFISY